MQKCVCIFVPNNPENYEKMHVGNSTIFRLNQNDKQKISTDIKCAFGFAFEFGDDNDTTMETGQ